MLCVLVCLLVLKPAKFRCQTECFLKFIDLSFQINEKCKHYDYIEHLTFRSLRRDVTEAHDCHRNDNVVQHIMISIDCHIFEIIFIGLVARVLSILNLLPHSLIECYVFNSEHAGSKQENDDNEGECHLERDSNHLRLDHAVQAEYRKQSSHPQ